MTQKIVNDISEGFLQCSICMERYDTVNKKPKMLPCIHSFCLPCLEELEGRFQRDGKLFSCPTCRALPVLPSSGVKDLPVNFLLVSLMERLSMTDTSGNVSSTCSFCRDEKDTLQFCIDCKFYVCPSCKTTHDKIPGTGDHVIIPVEKLSDEDFMKQVLAMQVPRCEKHREEKLRFYCLPCFQLACRDCLLLSHQGHECAEAESQVNEVKAKLAKLLEDSKAIVKGVNNIDAHLDNSRQKLEQNIQRVTEVINRRYDQRIEKLKSDRDQLLLEIQQKKNSVKAVSEEVKNYLRAMSNAEEVTEKILAGNNQWELLGMEKDLSDAFSKLSDRKEGLQRKSFHIQQNVQGSWECAPTKPAVDDLSQANENTLGKLIFRKSAKSSQMNPYVAEFWPKRQEPRIWRSLMSDP